MRSGTVQHREPTAGDLALAVQVLRGAAAQARAWHGYAMEMGIDVDGAMEAAAEAEGLAAVALVLEAKGGSHG